MRIVFAVVVLVTALAPSCWAGRNFDKIYTECGIGGMLFKDKPGLASFSNATWDSGTTAISSNISSQDTCEGGNAKTASLIFETYPLLEREIAAGKGGRLNALVKLAGCSGDGLPAVIGAIRQDLATLVEDGGYARRSRYERAKGLYERLNATFESKFAQSCKAT